MAITWDPNLAVGHQAMDDQHRELFRRIDALLEASRTGKSTGEVSRANFASTPRV